MLRTWPLSPWWPWWLLGIVWVALGVMLTVAAGNPDLPGELLRGETGRMGDWQRGPGQPGPWLIATGLLYLVILGLHAAGHSGSRATAAAGLVLALAVGMASFLVHVSRGKCGEVAGVGTVYWLDDDMMISLRYARNLAEGNGLVWNPGERVEGYTNLLWTLLLVPPHWIVPAERVAAVALAMNGLCFLLLLLASARLMRRLGGGPLATTAACLGLATYDGLVHWAAGGGEAVLTALLLVLLASETLRSDTPRTHRAGLLAALAALTRPDALVPAGILLAAGTLRAHRDPDCTRRSTWTGPAILAVALLLQALFRLTYYGELLPNTYHLKAIRWSGRGLAGLDYLLRLLSQHGLALGLACAALIGERVRPRRLLLGALAAGLVAIAWVGGDELPAQRFLVPLAPFLFVLAFLGAEAAGASFRPNLMPVLALGLIGLGGGLLPGRFDAAAAARADGEWANVSLGFRLRENTEPDARIAHFWAGAAAYFSERPGIDLFGKCDPVIARQAAHPGLMRPGHNKYDLDHSLGLAPDVIVAGRGGLLYVSDQPSHRAMLERDRRGPYRAFAELADHPEFQRHYRDHLVTGLRTSDGRDLSRQWHGVFVRQGSPRVRPPEQWVSR